MQCKARRRIIFVTPGSILRQGRSRAEFDSSDCVAVWNTSGSVGARHLAKIFAPGLSQLHRQQERLSPSLGAIANRRRGRPDDSGMVANEPTARRPDRCSYGSASSLTNARMILLFTLLVLMDQPAWYFVVEVTVFNLLLVLLLRRKTKFAVVFLPALQKDSARGFLRYEAGR